MFAGSGFHFTVWTVAGSDFRMVAGGRSITDKLRLASRALGVGCRWRPARRLDHQRMGRTRAGSEDPRPGHGLDLERVF